MQPIPVGRERLRVTFSSREEVAMAEKAYNYAIGKTVKQRVNRPSGYEVEYVCSDSNCGYNMRYHATRTVNSTGKREATGFWKSSVRGKDFHPCFVHSEFCMSSAKIGPKDLAKQPHIMLASSSISLRRPTIKYINTKVRTH
jgi:hypothetical protein